MATIHTEGLTREHWIAVVFAAITGVIHLYLSTPHLPNPLGLGFLFAGVGFLGWIALFLLDWRRDLLYLVGIPFVAGQLVLYVILNWPDIFFALGLLDKTVQIVLLIDLIVLNRRTT